jgi:hypothetical protein
MKIITGIPVPAWKLMHVQKRLCIRACLILASLFLAACVDFEVGPIPTAFGVHPGAARCEPPVVFPEAAPVAAHEAPHEAAEAAPVAAQEAAEEAAGAPWATAATVATAPETALEVAYEAIPFAADPAAPIALSLATPLSGLTSDHTPLAFIILQGSDAFQQLTVEELLFTVPDGWVSCSNIAAYFGITLDALYSANPVIHQNGRCVIHTSQELIIPPVPILTPAEYASRYECVPSGTRVCLQPDDPPEIMIAHTLFGEGGSSMGPSSAANIMQIAINRLNNLLGHRAIAAADLTDGEYQQLLIHILAQPYQGRSQEHPAFNAFADPFSHPEDPAEFQPASISRWNASLEIARSALQNGREYRWWDGHAPNPRIADPANQVLYYCSGPASSPPFNQSAYNSLVAAEDRNRDTLRSQWYYYNSSQYCSW